MGSSGDGKVRCEHCNKAYAWQEKYAGKKVRCKCGEVMRFPAECPTEEGMELALNLDSGIDLNLGSSSSRGSSSLSTPDGQLNVPPPANMGGPSCPSCKTTVRPGAVICINCGFNLKEGNKVNTAVGVQMAGGGQVYDDVADGIFGRLKRSWTFAKISYGMIWDFKQLLIFPICSAIAAILILISFIVPLVMIGINDARQEELAFKQQLAQNQTATADQADGQAASKAPTRALTAEEEQDFANMRQRLITEEGMTEDQADKRVAEAKTAMFELEHAFATLAEAGDEDNLSTDDFTVVDGIIAFAFYYCNYFAIAFFNTGLIACAMKIMEGQVPTVGYGFKVAIKRLPQIAAWALVSAVVGLILKIIENGHDKIGRIIAFFLGGAWTILTFFVVPVIAVEGVGPFKAVKRSFGTMKEAWGDSIAGNFSLGLMTFLVTLPIYIVLFAAFILVMGTAPSLATFVVMVAVTIMVVALIAVVSSAADTVFKAILYSFASGKTMPAGIDTDAIASAFAYPRKRGLLGLFNRD